MSIVSIDIYRRFAIKFLDNRYKYCNKEGHKNLVKGKCYYCYRNSPQTEQQKISDRNKGLVILINSLKELKLSK